MDTVAGNQYIYFYDNGASTNEALFWNETNATERFELTDRLHIDGTLTAQDDVVAYDDMRIGSSDANHHLYFYEAGNPTGERLTWDDASDHFYLSDSLDIGGTLSKGGGSFRIDHPLDPANKYLQHSFVESPDMMNIYNGNVVLDSSGEATIELPDWFEALNREFRYQLTCMGGYAPVYIAEGIVGNAFSIAGGSPGLKVSWQVTGVRQDVYAEAYRIPVESEKIGAERGTYLYPKLYE